MDYRTRALRDQTGDAARSQNRKESVASYTVPETEGEHRELAMEQFTTVQPHFKPGYTGHTPGSPFALGTTYGRWTHKHLDEHRVGGNRMCRVPGDLYIPPRHPSNADVDNPHETREPHFIPGYTGFIPGSGIRRSECFGYTYGLASHVKLAGHSLRGGRLRPVSKYPSEYVAEEEDVKFYNYEHELTRDDLKRKTRVLPGYTGHIPRSWFRHGKTGSEIAERSIAEFQQILNQNK